MRKGIDDFSFWDHLEDLRRKILAVVACFSLFFLAGYLLFSFRLIEALTAFAGRPFYYLSVFEPFFTRVKISFFLALLCALPIFLVQLIRFLLPGLEGGEKRVLLLTVPLVLLLTAGAGFLLFRVSPTLLGLFLESFAAPGVEYRLSVSTLISFYVMLASAAVVIVLIPAATLLLLRLGVFTPAAVARSRKYLVPFFLLLAAFITPPDPASMIAVAGPLWLVFESSLLIFRLCSRGSGNRKP